MGDAQNFQFCRAPFYEEKLAALNLPIGSEKNCKALFSIYQNNVLSGDTYSRATFEDICVNHKDLISEPDFRCHDQEKKLFAASKKVKEWCEQMKGNY